MQRELKSGFRIPRSTMAMFVSSVCLVCFETNDLFFFLFFIYLFFLDLLRIKVKVCVCVCVWCRDISKDKEKCEGEDEEGKEQNTPRGRKTANSQGRRKGRITTRSMANEAASTATEEPAAPAAPPPPPPPEPGKTHSHITLTCVQLRLEVFDFNMKKTLG